MAGTAAAAGLTASIASLIDLAAQVASRLHESASNTAEVPELFQSLSNRLPLLTSALQSLSWQAQAPCQPNDVTDTLQSLVQSTSDQVSILVTCLPQFLPPTDASLPQAVKGLHSLAKNRAIQTAMEKIHKNIDFLVLNQSTQHVDTGDRILEAFTNLQPAQAQAPTARYGHHFASVSTHDHSIVHLGDVYHFGQNEEPEIKAFGLCLGPAPLINPQDFIGRAAELDQMKQILRPGESAVEQRRVVLSGMGGIGKTQLAIAYARLCQASYTTVFWLNATTESTLKESFRLIARRLLKPSELEKLDDEQLVLRVHNWLTDTRNTQWLLIFDNYDDPDQFIIDDFMPNTAYGSVVITTRLPSLVSGQQVRVQPIEALDECLEILQTRSQRHDVKNDPDVRRLAERLAGLPLALATAGAYLRKTTLTFRQYLAAYDLRFNINPRRPIRLQEYQDRSLYTTWNLSYTRLESDDPLAAHVLKLLAYFDNQEIWFELLHAGVTDDLPVWLQELTTEQIDFENVMGTLVEYCLLEVHAVTGSYSMHSCVHDWALAELNKTTSHQLYWYAVKCVVANVDEEDDWESLGRLRYARVARHALRCVHHRFEHSLTLDELSLSRSNDAALVAGLLAQQEQHLAAEKMYARALAGEEKVLGPDHTSTLKTVHNLGNLYAKQGKLDEAERMYMRVLAAREKGQGPDYALTLDTVNNLGNLYGDQGKLDEAEQMYMRALAGYEKALGPDHISTLDTVHNLGVLYRVQGKLNEAERMYMQALAAREKALGSDHTLTLDTINHLGNLYVDQGKLDEAEQMYMRALAGYEKTLGPDHTSILSTVNNLGILYRDQDKLDEAEQMFMRAVAGYEKVLGPDHTLTLNTVNNLGILYDDQGKLDEAEQMYIRALAGYEKALGPDHISTLNTVNNLGNLYVNQGKLDEAEQMYMRALTGKGKALGPDHTSTLSTVNNLGVLYGGQDRLDEAEQMYIRALAGYEKALGPDHPSTLDTVYNLGNLYGDQGKLDEAEQMYMRALAGYEKALGPDHISTLNTVHNLGILYRDQGRLEDAKQVFLRVGAVDIIGSA